MLMDTHVPWVITGHSERRSLCGESNKFVGEKTGHALDVGLKVGVLLQQRRQLQLAQVNTSSCKTSAERTSSSCFAAVKE
jgi:triosephosphate isomerase